MESSYFFDENQLINGNQYATFENICLYNAYDKSKPFIELYSKDYKNNALKLIENMKKYYYNIYTFDLRVTNNYKSENKVFLEDDSWLISGSCGTLFHTFDFLLLWNLSKSQPSPPIKNVILAGVNSKYDNQMSMFLYHLYLHNKSYLFLQDINKYYRKGGYICFRKVNIISRRMFGHFGMFFENIKERKEFRDYGYKYLSINPQKNPKIIEIGIIYRDLDNSRKIVNENGMLDMINSLKRVYKNIRIERFAFDKMNAKEQILMIKNKNILISPSGSSLSNILWIVNPKVLVIECFSWFINGEIMHFTINNGYYYIPILPVVTYLGVYETFFNDNKFEKTPFTFQPFFATHPLKWAEISRLQIYVVIKRIKFAIDYGFNGINNYY